MGSYLDGPAELQKLRDSGVPADREFKAKNKDIRDC